MKAFVVEKYGKEGLRAGDVPEPIIGDRDVLVRAAAASINPLDKMVRNGEFKQLLKYKPPFTLGHDVAGVVAQVGAEVRDFKVGDEVFARPRDRLRVHQDPLPRDREEPQPPQRLVRFGELADAGPCRRSGGVTAGVSLPETAHRRPRTEVPGRCRGAPEATHRPGA